MNSGDITKAREAILEDMKRRYQAHDPSVKPSPKGYIGSGSFPCPICNKGELRYSRASNGHVHARCMSGSCVAWME